jgi:uncharacterized protein involved in cysteine biosynthesis
MFVTFNYYNSIASSMTQTILPIYFSEITIFRIGFKLFLLLIWISLFILTFKFVLFFICDFCLSELSIIVEEEIFGKVIVIPQQPIQQSKTENSKGIMSQIFEWIIMTTLGIILSMVLPGLGLIGYIVYLFYSQCFSSGEFSVNYVLERKQIDKEKFQKEHLGLYYGLGTGYMLIFMIPFVGIIFASSLTTITGSMVTCNMLKKEK